MSDISVVIPTHQRDYYLETAIRSVAAQSRKPDEVIVVDDTSSEATRRQVDELATRYGLSLRYEGMISDNGVSRSYNYGAARAAGDVLAFLDDDDYWQDGYLERALQALQSAHADAVWTSFSIVTDDGNMRPGKTPVAEFRIEDFFLKNPGIVRSNLCIRRSVFEALDGYDESIFGSSDKELLIRLSEAGYSHTVIREPLVFWRMHDGQVSTNPRRVLRNLVPFFEKYQHRMNQHYQGRMRRKIAKFRFLAWVRRVLGKDGA
jgi:glycosyltransferase involved in cell wall biosynthesis